MCSHQNKMISAGLIMWIALTNQSQAANECDYYQEGVEHYEKLRRMGGSADEMDFWTTKGHELEDKLYHCRQNSTINPVIQTTAKEAPVETSAVKRQYLPLRSSSADDPQLQRLIDTCNYWIKQSNENASQDNQNFRATACGAVDKHQFTQENPSTPTTAPAVRPLKDCIKPNNYIDHEVNECVKGNIAPTWKK